MTFRVRRRLTYARFVHHCYRFSYPLIVFQVRFKHELRRVRNRLIWEQKGDLGP